MILADGNVLLGKGDPTPKDWRWPHFLPTELRCKCGCETMQMQVRFLDLLEGSRLVTGFAWPITSGYRCMDYERDDSIKGSGLHHPKGGAVDTALTFAQASRVVSLAEGLGFTGLGIKAHGPTHKRLVHLDITHTVWTVWTYE